MTAPAASPRLTIEEFLQRPDAEEFELVHGLLEETTASLLSS
jgi:Uma2 family endonuclease